MGRGPRRQGLQLGVCAPARRLPGPGRLPEAGGEAAPLGVVGERLQPRPRPQQRLVGQRELALGAPHDGAGLPQGVDDRQPGLRVGHVALVPPRRPAVGVEQPAEHAIRARPLLGGQGGQGGLGVLHQIPRPLVLAGAVQPRRQRRRQGAPVCGAVLGRRGDRRPHDAFEAVRDATRGPRPREAVLEASGIRAGLLAGQHPEQHGTQCIDVAGRGQAVDRPRRLLGRHVAVGAGDLPGARLEAPRRAVRPHRVGADGQVGRRRAPDLGQAPVQDEHLPAVAHQDVLRLEVAVQHPARVREAHRLGHRADRLDEAHPRPAARVRSPGPARGGRVYGVDDGIEGLAGDLTHRVEDRAVRQPPDVVDRHDGGVLQLGGDLGLLAEAGLERGDVGEAVGADDLERHDPPQVQILDPPHRAHAALPDGREGPVSARRRDGARHVVRRGWGRGPGAVGRPGVRRHAALGCELLGRERAVVRHSPHSTPMRRSGAASVRGSRRGCGTRRARCRAASG